MKKRVIAAVVLVLVLGAGITLGAVNRIRTTPWLAYADLQAADVTNATLTTEDGDVDRGLTPEEVERLAAALRELTPEDCTANPEHAGTTPDRWITFEVNGERRGYSWCGSRQSMALRFLTEEYWFTHSDELNALLYLDDPE